MAVLLLLMLVVSSLVLPLPLISLVIMLFGDRWPVGDSFFSHYLRFFHMSALFVFSFTHVVAVVGFLLINRYHELGDDPIRVDLSNSLFLLRARGGGCIIQKKQRQQPLAMLR